MVSYMFSLVERGGKKKDVTRSLSTKTHHPFQTGGEGKEKKKKGRGLWSCVFSASSEE